MNISKLKQWLQNNLWFGEQGKREPHRAVPASLIQPNYNRHWGIDVSPWDGLVNLAQTKALGAEFVFIKAIDGTLTAKYFPENRQRAKDAGLLDGAYGWLYRNANVSCVAQAQAYDALMNKYPVSLPPGIDFEPTKWGGVQSNPTFSDLRTWATEWLRLGNPKAILYSAAYYMNQFGQIPNDLKGMFAGLWVAHYGTNNPSLPLGYLAGSWVFHQFAEDGDAKIIAPNSNNKQATDLNYAINQETLYRLAGQTPTQPPTGEPPMPIYKGTVITDGLRLRVSPNTSASIILKFSRNDKVEASEVNKGWWHIIKHNDTIVTGYAYEGDTKNYIRTDTVVTPPPASDEHTEIAGAIVNLSQKVDNLDSKITSIIEKVDSIKNDTVAIRQGTPGTPPTPVPASDGYTGPDMGVYRIIEAPDQQEGNVITTIQDSYSNEKTILMDKMFDWGEAKLPGWNELVHPPQDNVSPTVSMGEDGYWHYEIKLVKGGLVRIAEVGGKTAKNPLGNGRIIGVDSEGLPTHGAVNMDAVSIERTPYYIHKIPNVKRYLLIPQPRQQKGMEALNAWWFPMRWLRKVEFINGEWRDA